jgi:hypothetical protein
MYETEINDFWPFFFLLDDKISRIMFLLANKLFKQSDIIKFYTIKENLGNSTEWNGGEKDTAKNRKCILIS